MNSWEFQGVPQVVGPQDLTFSHPPSFKHVCLCYLCKWANKDDSVAQLVVLSFFVLDRWIPTDRELLRWCSLLTLVEH